MLNFLQSVLSLEPTKFASSSFTGKFEEWDKPSRQIQISAIAFLTALLYLFFSLIEKPWASEAQQTLMLQVHLLVVVPMLFAISFLAYKRRLYRLTVNALAVSPIISICCNAYITSKLPFHAPYQIEGYMIIFWTFVISGLTFKHALISATLSSLILLLAAFFFMNHPGYFTMHVFWVLCSFSFGLLGAFIFNTSRKAVFHSHLELHQMAITDNLTGAFNRNQLNHLLREEMVNRTANNKPFGMLILDIDHFKMVNDTLGHDAGDKVLKQTAALISKLTGAKDTLIRWGGEEFIIVMLEIDKQQLIQFSEHLRTQIELEDFDTPENMTVSIGATLFKDEDTQDKLIARADKALYQAKAEGRNQTVFL